MFLLVTMKGYVYVNFHNSYALISNLKTDDMSLLYFFDAMVIKSILPDKPSSYNGKVWKYVNLDRSDFFHVIYFITNWYNNPLFVEYGLVIVSEFSTLFCFECSYKMQRLIVKTNSENASLQVTVFAITLFQRYYITIKLQHKTFILLWLGFLLLKGKLNHLSLYVKQIAHIKTNVGDHICYYNYCRCYQRILIFHRLQSSITFEGLT